MLIILSFLSADVDDDYDDAEDQAEDGFNDLIDTGMIWLYLLKLKFFLA